MIHWKKDSSGDSYSACGNGVEYSGGGYSACWSRDTDRVTCPDCLRLIAADKRYVHQIANGSNGMTLCWRSIAERDKYSRKERWLYLKCSNDLDQVDCPDCLREREVAKIPRPDRFGRPFVFEAGASMTDIFFIAIQNSKR